MRCCQRRWPTWSCTRLRGWIKAIQLSLSSTWYTSSSASMMTSQTRERNGYWVFHIISRTQRLARMAYGASMSINSTCWHTTPQFGASRSSCNWSDSSPKPNTWPPCCFQCCCNFNTMAGLLIWNNTHRCRPSKNTTLIGLGSSSTHTTKIHTGPTWPRTMLSMEIGWSCSGHRGPADTISSCSTIWLGRLSRGRLLTSHSITRWSSWKMKTSLPNCY